MLHVLLMILKVIGLIIAVILGILLCMILAVLFIPLVYQVETVKSENSPADSPGISGSVSWLFHILRVKATFCLDKSLHLSIYLFGFCLPFFQNKKKRTKSVSTDSTEKKTDTVTVQDELSDDQNVQNINVDEHVVPDNNSDESLTQEEDQKDNQEVTQENKYKLNEDKSKEGTLKKDKTKKDKTKKDKSKKDKSKKDKTQNNKEEKGSIKEKAVGIKERVVTLYHKPEEYLSLASRLQIKELIGDGFGYLKYLLKHYGIRKIKGYLKFGTGDPALTGKLTGLFYLLLPKNARQFRLDQDFYEFCLEGDFSCKGHIRVIHVLIVAWKIFWNKKVRRLWKFVRRKKQADARKKRKRK